MPPSIHSLVNTESGWHSQVREARQQANAVNTEPLYQPGGPAAVVVHMKA
jgi:hypothetical protein